MVFHVEYQQFVIAFTRDIGLPILIIDVEAVRVLSAGQMVAGLDLVGFRVDLDEGFVASLDTGVVESCETGSYCVLPTSPPISIVFTRSFRFVSMTVSTPPASSETNSLVHLRRIRQTVGELSVLDSLAHDELLCVEDGDLVIVRDAGVNAL